MSLYRISDSPTTTRWTYSKLRSWRHFQDKVRSQRTRAHELGAWLKARGEDRRRYERA